MEEKEIKLIESIQLTIKKIDKVFDEAGIGENVEY